MKVPVNWLKNYVDIEDIDIKTLENKLIMSGSNTEQVHNVAEGTKKVVIGKIEKIEKHPDADKLIICDVNTGDGNTQIVTGATNVNEGDIVPTALVGAWLPGDFKIKRTKLRGVKSEGMLVSLEELGFGDSVIPKELRDGIWVLDPSNEDKIGQELMEATDLNDQVIEFEITPNRADCLSMIGMARETAATFERELQIPEIKLACTDEEASTEASIDILDPDLCPRFTARVIKNVKIEPSPLWMQLRLMKAGMRPINNIVDISNYVMLEYGQPTHAYDLDTIAGKTIITRRAKAGEVIVTLDDVERKLDESYLVIADGDKAIGLAGIMGGDETEVKDHTQNILLEAANFNKTNIRESSKKLGLRSEASSRFEKGVDPELAAIASNRVCQLIEELGAGTVVGGIIDLYKEKPEPRKILVREQRVNQILGTQLDSTEIVDILKRLKFEMIRNDENISITIPSYRPDLEKEIDMIEEIARIYGYDEIPTTIPMGNHWGAKTNGQQIEEFTKSVLTSNGANEITTYSFVSPKQFDQINAPDYSIMRNTVNLINPLGEEYSIMRTTLVANMLEVLGRNYNRSLESVTAFEIGNLFLPKQVPVTELPIEKKSLVIGKYGENVDFFTIKGIVCNLLDRLGVKDYRFDAEKNNGTYHPGRCANIIWGDHILGTFGEVHPIVLENFDIKAKAYIADLDFNILMQLTRMDRIYKALPKYPAITRDIAILVDETVTASQIDDVIKTNGGKYLEGGHVFDVYKGKQIPDGKKSVAYTMTFRAENRTLTDEEIKDVYDKLLRKLTEELEAELR